MMTWRGGGDVASYLPKAFIVRGKRKTPVFSGVTACFDSMLNSYDAPYRRTVYGLTDPYITGNEEALTASFDDWIGLYVAAIKTKQEQGPYTFMATRRVSATRAHCIGHPPHRLQRDLVHDMLASIPRVTR